MIYCHQSNRQGHVAGPMEAASDGYAWSNWNLSRRAEAQGASGRILPTMVHAGGGVPDFNQHPLALCPSPSLPLPTFNPQQFGKRQQDAATGGIPRRPSRADVETRPRETARDRGQWWWSPAHRRRLGVQTGTAHRRKAWRLAG